MVRRSEPVDLKGSGYLRNAHASRGADRAQEGNEDLAPQWMAEGGDDTIERNEFSSSRRAIAPFGQHVRRHARASRPDRPLSSR